MMETETETAAARGQAQESARESAPAQEIFITVSDALEYLFCPRFIFFERCLMIPEHQEKRYKVLKGRELHEILMIIQRGYFPDGTKQKARCVDCMYQEYMRLEYFKSFWPKSHSRNLFIPFSGSRI